MNTSLQIQPTKLTHWAAKNVAAAVCIIVLIETLKFSIGFYIGKNAFPIFSAETLRMATLLIVVTVFVAENFFKEKLLNASRKASFNLIARGNLVLFTTSLFLSLIAGNQWARLHNPAENPAIFAALTVEKKTTINSDSVLRAIQQEQQLKRISQAKTKGKSSAQTTDNDGLQRLGYFALFALAMMLTFFGIYLACALACGGYGIFAVLVFLLDIGIFGGGIYFLLKVFKKGQIKRWREMDKTERKKEGKRYLLTTLISVTVAALWFIISSSFS